jgi:hydroxyacylglutathione hydrolase
MAYEIFSSGPAQTNSVLVYSDKSNEALLFDAPLGCVEHWDKRLKKLGKKLSVLLLTHSHWDHIADASLAKQTWGAPLGIHKDDAPNLIQPGSDSLRIPFFIEGVNPDFHVAEGKTEYAGFSCQVFHTPGHTPGGVCFYFPEFGILITGDTLFHGSIGRLDFPSSRPHLMRSSLEKILALPHGTIVIPGHGSTSSIGEEQDIIERFRL